MKDRDGGWPTCVGAQHGDEAGLPAGVVRLRDWKQARGAAMPPVSRAAEADARLVARLLVLIDEAMEIARLRGGPEGAARVDSFAIEIFRELRADEGMNGA